MIDLTIIREILIKHVPSDIAVLIIKCMYVDKNTSFIFRVIKTNDVYNNVYNGIIDGNFNDVDIMLYICEYIDITQHNMDTWEHDKIFIDSEFCSNETYCERLSNDSEEGYGIKSKSEIIGHLLLYMMRIIFDEDDIINLWFIYDRIINNGETKCSYNLLEIINMIAEKINGYTIIYTEEIKPYNSKIIIWEIDIILNLLRKKLLYIYHIYLVSDLFHH